MSVEVDEIALIAVPMPADPVPAFADNMIMEQNENESNHEEQAQDAVEEEILEIEADDDRVSEDEGEGEGQGFVESDIESCLSRCGDFYIVITFYFLFAVRGWITYRYFSMCFR